MALRYPEERDARCQLMELCCAPAETKSVVPATEPAIEPATEPETVPSNWRTSGKFTDWVCGSMFKCLSAHTLLEHS